VQGKLSQEISGLQQLPNPQLEVFPILLLLASAAGKEGFNSCRSVSGRIG
jgi:hypothetical protein